MSLLDLFKRKQVDNLGNIESGSISNVFYNYDTERAYNMYNDDSEKYNNLKLPKSIVSTIVTSASQEFDFDIKSEANEFDKIGKYLKNNIKIVESHLCIGGLVALKPYINNKRIGVSIYNARDFVAYYDEYGALEKVYFKSDIRESEFVSYTLVEIHTYNELEREYRIDYQLYKGTNNDLSRKLGKQAPQLGSRVPLSACDKTAYLNDFVVIEDVDKHLCTIISLDNSMSYNKGQSIYNSSIDLISNAESLYDSLLWEYKGGELAIDANADLFRQVGSSIGKNKFVLPEGKERLYRKLEGGSLNNNFGIQVFAPTLRDSNYINGLNEILRKIESNCGLYYGALSNVNDTQKTASEVISSKQRFYVTVMDIKNKLKDGIEDIVENCCMIHNRNIADFLKADVKIDFNIGDSVIDIVQPTNTSNK